jgi:hypothetical protein
MKSSHESVREPPHHYHPKRKEFGWTWKCWPSIDELLIDGFPSFSFLCTPSFFFILSDGSRTHSKGGH